MRERDRVDEARAALLASKGAFLSIGFLSLFINLLMLTAPLYMLQVYDRVLASRSSPTLIALTVLAGGLLLVMGSLELLRSRVLVRIGASLDERLSTRLFSAVFRGNLLQPHGQFAHSLRDLDQLRQFLTGNGPFALFDVPWVPVYLAVAFLFHPILGYIGTAGAVVIFVLVLLSEARTRGLLLDANRSAQSAQVFAEASLRNGEALDAMGMLDVVRRRWARRHDRALALQARASDRAGTLTSWTKAVRLFLQVAILGAGAALAIEQIITPGTMIAASIIVGRALAPVEQAIANWRGFLAARQAYKRLSDILTSVPPDPIRLQLPEPKGHLTVEHASAVAPGGQRPILRDIDFLLAPGEALGVIGPSASGKTTLARLLVGIWRPAAGAVRLDRAELHNWDRGHLGPHVGYLPQGVELFDGSVGENIARLAEEPDAEAVVRAAERAGVHEMILRLEDGYDTRIGEGGRVLSGGQRQRIGLARALYGDPALIVLDEPNANLDAAGDQALMDAILTVKGEGKTVVVMAHRPSAIAAVDKLLMLAEGRVQAFGDKEEVLARVAASAGAQGKVAALHPQGHPQGHAPGQPQGAPA